MPDSPHIQVYCLILLHGAMSCCQPLYLKINFPMFLRWKTGPALEWLDKKDLIGIILYYLPAKKGITP
jgi:hypothetical protein